MDHQTAVAASNQTFEIRVRTSSAVEYRRKKREAESPGQTQAQSKCVASCVGGGTIRRMVRQVNISQANGWETIVVLI